MKQFIFLFLVSAPVFAMDSLTDYTCTIKEETTKSIFYCINRVKYDDSAWFLQEGDKAFQKEVEPVLQEELKRELQKAGVKFLDPASFATVSFFDMIKELNRPHTSPGVCYQKVQYTADEFNRLGQNHSTIIRLRNLAKALKEAGVCGLPVLDNNTSHKIDVKNNDDLLEHFLCISNSESVFGRDNIGIGGRGPFGIHPMHNQRAGTKAFTGGKTVTLKKNQLCYPSKAIVRNSSGQEVKNNESYKTWDVQVDNARCAMKLYKRKAYSDWGRGGSWGSNRHCTRTKKDRFDFKKHLGVNACCTQACREKISPTY